MVAVSVIRVSLLCRELDRDIRDIIRRQSDSGYDGRQALEDAEKTIEVLFARIKNIREKAQRTEQTVSTGEEGTLELRKFVGGKEHSISVLVHSYIMPISL